MIPYRDDNPTVNMPIATYILIGMNVIVWVVVQGLGQPEALYASFCHYALIPGDLLGTAPEGAGFPVSSTAYCQLNGSSMETLFTSMFMHGGWMHIIGNMLFLWVFGDNVEDVMGPFRFVFFYLLCGLAAAFAQIATDPSSAVPMVGASGAIGGVMGAYAMLFPKARVHLLVILIVYVTTISVPAVFMLGYWFLLQLISGVGTLGASGGGVAFWAHIGGFIAGVVLVFVFKDPAMVREKESLSRREGAKHNWFN